MAIPSMDGRKSPELKAYISPKGCNNISFTQGFVTVCCLANRDSKLRHIRAIKFRRGSGPHGSTTIHTGILREDVYYGSDCIAQESPIHGRRLLIHIKFCSQGGVITGV